MSARRTGWRAWRTAEEKVLRERYPVEGATQLAKDLGRTRHAVATMARRLGVKCPRQAPQTLSDIRDRCEVEDAPYGKGCWVWQGATGGLHHTPRIHKPGNKTIVVRRFVWELVHGEPPPEGRYVVARCRCSMCVNPDHLRLVTPQQHIRSVMKGKPKNSAATIQRTLTRIRRGTVRLDWEKAAEIRLMEGSCQQIAEKYGVSASMVNRVRLGKSWREPAIGQLM